MTCQKNEPLTIDKKHRVVLRFESSLDSGKSANIF